MIIDKYKKNYLQDSLIYKYPEATGDPLPTGEFLGDLTDEIPAHEELEEFVSGKT